MTTIGEQRPGRGPWPCIGVIIGSQDVLAGVALGVSAFLA